MPTVLSMGCGHPGPCLWLVWSSTMRSSLEARPNWVADAQSPRVRAADFEGKIRANPDARGGLRVRWLPSQTQVFRVLLRDAQYERGQVRLNPG